MKKYILSVCLALFAVAGFAKNDTETVDNITEARALTTPLDLIITATSSPITANVDIANEDAAVIFRNIVPSSVIASYLRYIKINGATAANGTNCRVTAYLHGAIVQPFGNSFKALEVFSEKDFQGEKTSYAAGGRVQLPSTWNNKIRSFKLKRGYMATLANHADGTGYSHCYIADRENLSINLPASMAGRVSMLRVFKWTWVSKKGCSDARDENMMNTSKATWYYDWGAGTKSRTNHEYVPQRHHEAGQSNGQGYKGAWESWTNINASNETCTHVLGQNEPDNTSGAGEVYTYVTSIPSNPREKHGDYPLINVAKDFLYSGKRIGTFACCNPNTGWVTEYVKWCRENNIRVDFVATHYYIGGQSPQGCIDRLWSLYNATGLPVWATEWNNGANWSGESGFSTDAGWYTWGTGNDNAKNGEWLRDVLRRADKPENKKWLERLAVYNAVEGRREIYTNGKITDGGKIWGAYESDFAYDSEAGSISYFMPWTHHAPKDFTATVATLRSGTKITFTWTNPNTDMTDLAIIEERVNGKWTEFKREETLNETGEYKVEVTIDDSYPSGLHTFRVHTKEYDGKEQYTGEASISIAGALSVGPLMYGRIDYNNYEALSVPFTQTYDPVIIAGGAGGASAGSGNNFGAGGQVTTSTRTAGVGKSFSWKAISWQTAEAATENITSAERSDFVILPHGNFRIGEDFFIETGDSIKVNGQVTEVTFRQPWPIGETPIVIAQQMYNASYATTVNVFDVTNTGFKIQLKRQTKETVSFASQNISYIAVSQGKRDLGMGKAITAGLFTDANGQVITSKVTRLISGISAYFGGESLKDPYIISGSQDNNFTFCADMVRISNRLTDYVTLRRSVDPTGTYSTIDLNKAEYSNRIGYIAISDNGNAEENPEPTLVRTDGPTGISDIMSETDGINPASAYTISGTKVNGKLRSGVYIINNGGKTRKVMVK